MEITNTHNLPEAFVNFARNDKYSKGISDISVTTLIDSPRIRLMRDHHASDRTSDVVDMIWPLFGTAVHHILESAKTDDNTIVEERLFCKVNGWVLSGAIDQQIVDRAFAEIVDYKVTSVWSVIHGKIEWEQQLNCYAYLVQKNKGKKVRKLSICAILRDWNRRDAEHKADYPKSPVVMVEVPLWDDAKRVRYIHDRINAHQEAQIMYDLEEAFTPCSDEDRWKRGEAWAVKKKGLKRAMRVFDNEDDANEFATAQTVPVEIEHRAGEYVRCKGDYCGVAQFCSQFREGV